MLSKKILLILPLFLISNNAFSKPKYETVKTARIAATVSLVSFFQPFGVDLEPSKDVSDIREIPTNDPLCDLEVVATVTIQKDRTYRESQICHVCLKYVKGVDEGDLQVKQADTAFPECFE